MQQGGAEKQVERTKNRKGMRKINNANMALEGEKEVWHEIKPQRKLDV